MPHLNALKTLIVSPRMFTASIQKNLKTQFASGTPLPVHLRIKWQNDELTIVPTTHKTFWKTNKITLCLLP